MSILIIIGFFETYFDRLLFRGGSGVSASTGVERTELKEAEVDILIKDLFYKIRDIYEIQSPLLTFEQKCQLFKALNVLNNSASTSSIFVVH